MPVFADYARYYNLLYQDKDYAGETVFVLNVLRAHGCTPKAVLDLGCGTGRHAVEMAKQGVCVTGVDMSETMLFMGQEIITNLEPSAFSVPLPELRQDDVRTVRLGRKFDAVICLFHVMSYQNCEEDALALFTTAKKHLKHGGLFLFDFWHGLGVLADPPVRREKQWEDSEVGVTRIASPVHRADEHIVEVHYSMTVQDKEKGDTSSFFETHMMRYWFLPELRQVAEEAGMRILAEGGWMHSAPPAPGDWSAWMLARPWGRLK